MTQAKGPVVIAYLHGEMVHARFAQSLLKLTVANFGQVASVIHIQSSVNVSGPRNLMVKRFLTEYPDVEWLLMFDVDHGFEPTLLSELLRVAHPKQRPIVSGVYVNKMGEQGMRIIATSKEDGRLMAALPAKPYVEIFSAGAGCLLVHRSVLEAIEAEKYSTVFPWFQETETDDGVAISEDITFCLRAKLLGYKIYLATQAQLDHEKSIVYTVGDLK